MPSLRRVASDITHILNSKGHTWFPTGANLQNAIDDLANGGKVWLPYAPETNPLLVNTPIVLPEPYPIHLHGMGPKHTWIMLDDGADCNVIQCVPTGAVSFHMLSDLNIHGNKLNNTLGSGVYFSDAEGGNVNDVHMRNVWIQECPEYNFYSSYFWGYHITDCLFERAGVTGAYIPSGTSGAFLHCRFGANEKRGAFIQASRTRFIACECMNNEEEGVWINDTDVEVLGGYVVGNSQIGADTHPGIHLGVAGDRTIIVGVEFDGGSLESYGVNIVAGATDVRIDECSFRNHVTAPINDLGTSTRIQGLGREAALTGVAPVAANWNIGDIVQNPDFPTEIWTKDYAGVMRRIA